MNDMPAEQSSGRQPTAGDLPAEPRGAASDLDAIAALADPARRALYAFVTARHRPVSRDEAADATGMKRPTAAFHLERLVEDGLLEARFARLSGRTGPGAGRTAKLYSRAQRQIDVSLPPRHYALAASVLADAVASARLATAAVDEAVVEAAQRVGRTLADSGGSLTDVLTSVGYEPRTAGSGEIQLANCPFHDLVLRHAALTCEMNLHLLTGLLAGLGLPGSARLTPAAGRCCVSITPGPDTAGRCR